MNNLAKIIGLGLLSGLAACGGGGGNDLAFPSVINDPNDFAFPSVTNDPTAQTRGVATAMNFEAMSTRVSANDPTAAATPTTGSAQYTGFAGVALGDSENPDAAYIGDAVVNADFASGSVTGNASSFTLSDDTNNSVFVDGTLTLNNGTIGANGVINGSVAGELTSPNITTEINLPVIGLFSDANAGGVSIVTRPNSTISVNDGTITGTVAIVGERAAQ